MIKTDSQEYVTQGRIRTAARLAPKVYPGPVGELLRTELDAWADLSFLWVSGAGSKRMRAVVEDVIARHGAGG